MRIAGTARGAWPWYCAVPVSKSKLARRMDTAPFRAPHHPFLGGSDVEKGERSWDRSALLYQTWLGFALFELQCLCPCLRLF